MRRWWIGAAVAAALAAGCRGEVELGGVSGTVTMDGKPLPDATLKFIPEGPGRTAYGVTDAEGRYELQYSASAAGGLVGPARVEITTGDSEQGRPETVPAKYNKQSTLREEVESGSNTIDFELLSK